MSIISPYENGFLTHPAIGHAEKEVSPQELCDLVLGWCDNGREMQAFEVDPYSMTLNKFDIIRKYYPDVCLASEKEALKFVRLAKVEVRIPDPFA